MIYTKVILIDNNKICKFAHFRAFEVGGQNVTVAAVSNGSRKVFLLCLLSFSNNMNFIN